MMKHKSTALLCALCITLTGIPSPEPLLSMTVSAADPAPVVQTEGILNYTEADGQITLTGATEQLPEEFVFPSEIGGLPVTAIGMNAFQKQKTLSVMTLPEHLVTVGEDAFYDCDALKSVYLPDSVREVGRTAFGYCDIIGEVRLNEGLTTIGNLAFYGAKETELTIPSTVETIGTDAFKFNPNLTSIVIPATVKNLGATAFMNCYALESATVENGIETLPAGLFTECKKLTSFEIPDSVTSIGDSCFTKCAALQSITIPASVQTIGNKAFAEDPALETVILNEGLTAIGENAFSEDAAITEITLPSTLTSIGRYAFQKTSLTSVDLPASLTDLGDSIFDGCKSLTSITIPDGITSIPARFLVDCTKLESVVLPDSVTAIGSSAFFGCSKLSSITIPETVTEIGGHAFKYTPFMDSLKENGPLTVINQILVDASPCEGDVVIPDGVRIISEYCFDDYHNENVTSVTVPEGVVRIADEGLSDLRKVEQITLPESLEEIGGMAFNGDYALKSIEIPDRVGDRMGGYVLSSCSSLETVKLPAGMTVLPHNIFTSDKALKNVELPAGLLTISDSAFYGCTALTQLTLPETLTTIGSSAFSNCTALTDLTLPESVTKIDRSAFADVQSLGNITFLNPYCEFPMEKSFLYTNDQYAKPPFKGIIHGYDNSTAQKYAEKYSIAFESLGAAPSYITTTPTTTTTTTTTSTTTITSTTVITSRTEPTTTVTRPTTTTQTVTTAPVTVTVPTTTDPVTTTAVTTTTVPTYNGMRYRVYYDYQDKEQENPLIVINGYTDDMPHEVEIPSEIDGVPVRRITGFRECYRLHTISIPEGVEIDSRCFEGCNYLEEVVLPNDLKVIDKAAFYGCDCLKRISIPESVKEIRDDAFTDCISLTSITLPDGLERLKSNAFKGCTNLAPVTIPANAKDGYASVDPCFFGHYHDKRVTTTSNEYVYSNTTLAYLTEMEELVVESNRARAANLAAAPALRRVFFMNPECEITWSGNEKFNALEEVCGYEGSLAEEFAAAFNVKFTALTSDDLSQIPALTPIQTNPYSENLTYLVKNDEIVISNLNTATPSKSVITIPEKIEGKPVTELALADTDTFPHSLRVLNIPKTVKVIDVSLFSYQDTLAEINVDPDNEVFSSIDGVLFNKDQTELILYPSAKVSTEYTIPSTVKKICDKAFHDSDYPAYINVPDGLETVEMFAFNQCRKLYRIDFSKTKAVFDAFVFERCEVLDELTLPASIEELPNSMCENCPSLKKIVIPESVKLISYEAFVNCKKLNHVTLPEGLEEIRDYAFAGCESLEEIVIPEKVKQIVGAVFHDDTALRSVTVLNPDCYIYDDPRAISNGRVTDESTGKRVEYYNGVIRAYSGSKLEEYANKYGYRFESIGIIPSAVTTTSVTTTSTSTSTTTTTRVTVSPPIIIPTDPTGTTTSTAPITTTSTAPVTTTSTTTPITTTSTTAPVTTSSTTALVTTTSTTAPVTTTSTTSETTTTVTTVPASTVRGDLNGDGALTIADAVVMSRFIAEDLPAEQIPAPDVLRQLDFHSDGLLTLLDIRKMISMITK